MLSTTATLFSVTKFVLFSVLLLIRFGGVRGEGSFICFYEAFRGVSVYDSFTFEFMGRNREKMDKISFVLSSIAGYSTVEIFL